MSKAISQLKNNRSFAPLLVIALLFALMINLFGNPTQQGAQAAVITPAASINARGAEAARVVTFFDNQAITSDTRKCHFLKDFETLDLQAVMDAGTANTTTVTVQNTNTDPNGSSPTPVYNAANAVATIVSTDASTMLQVPLFGAWNCVLADVTNSNTITFTIIGVAK